MTYFIIKRLLQAGWVISSVAILAFALFQYVGDPVSQMLGQDATAAQRAQLRETLGLDQPFYVQFYVFLKNLLTGDFGISLKQGRPVSELIIERLPATLELSGVAFLLAIIFGVPLGIITALKPKTIFSRSILMVSLLGVSLPTFFLGIIFIFTFSVTLGWLPSFGRGETVNIGWWRTGLLTYDGWVHMILPALTLCLFQLTLVVRLVRGEMLEILKQDFIQFTKARGLSAYSVFVRHALRNTLLPVVTIVGLQLGTVIAFALITETVFQWPGMGLLFAESIAFADVPVMAAYLCLTAIIFVVINLAVDILYMFIDPRIGRSASGDTK